MLFKYASFAMAIFFWSVIAVAAFNITSKSISEPDFVDAKITKDIIRGNEPIDITIRHERSRVNCYPNITFSLADDQKTILKSTSNTERDTSKIMIYLPKDIPPGRYHILPRTDLKCSTISMLSLGPRVVIPSFYVKVIDK